MFEQHEGEGGRPQRDLHLPSQVPLVCELPLCHPSVERSNIEVEDSQISQADGAALVGGGPEPCWAVIGAYLVAS